MAELIDKGALVADFNNSGIHIEFDLPVEEILGEDVDINDFTMLVQDAIQAYRKMVIGTIQKQSTITEAEIRAKAYDRFLTEMLNEFDSKNADIENHTGSYVVSRLQKIAEQLKEE